MYMFKKSKKAELLSGRTITYVANKIGITPNYLTAILNNKRGCSKLVAHCITKCFCQEAEIIDYFIKKEED